MSKVLFLGIPSHGHMNPTLGLTAALVKNGEAVTFFASAAFKSKVEAAGAVYKEYKEDLDIFKMNKAAPGAAPAAGIPAKPAGGGIISILLKPEAVIADVLQQIQGETFDYIIFSAAFPFGNTIAEILQLSAVSSFAVFAVGKEIINKMRDKIATPELMGAYKTVSGNIRSKYHVAMPEDPLSLFINKGELNIVYTSRYFAPNLDDFDSSFIFVGPPVYEKADKTGFPFELLEGKKVIYISLGTVFSNYSTALNELFFTTFADSDAVVVMTAYNVDLSRFNIPTNFIVRNYVPQLEILPYVTVAITHAGMNSIGDMLYTNTPFVAIPLGADQFFLSRRAAELGATIALDAASLTPEKLQQAVDEVVSNPSYQEASKKISQSFREAGGYQKAVEEIFELKKRKGIA